MDTDHEEHLRYEAMLGAYADGELGEADGRALARHIETCERCRQGLAVQRAVAARLAAEPLEPIGETLRRRLLAPIRSSPAEGAVGLGPVGAEAAPLDVGRGSRRWRAPMPPWLGWATAATVALAWAASEYPARLGPSPESTRAPSKAVTAPLVGQRIPMVEEALADYRTLEVRELPVQVEDPAALAGRLPFPVPSLDSPELRLVGAWTTVIRGEQAAVVAYRWQNHVLVQYVVSEQLFFRQPVVRSAVAAAGVFSAQDGALGIVGWPEQEAGTILIGDLSVQELMQVRS